MRKTSLAHATAHLSEIVDAAEHHGKTIVILRHGRPAAAIVPVAVAVPPKRAPARGQTVKGERRSVKAFIDEFSAAEPEVSAVEDLLRGRR